MSDLWIELHTRALNFKEALDHQYLYQFGARIPRYTTGCKCREFWTVWIRKNPPDFKNYFEWTVKAHNAVNKKLNKPEITVEEARKLYQHSS